MKIIQLLPTISYGDAVGNDARAIKRLLVEMGYETQIYAENVDHRLPRGTAEPVSQLPPLQEDDIIIYHGSTGTALNDRLPELGGRKLMIYHNITPPHFFRPYSATAQELTAAGICGMERLANKLEYCIAVSEFNKRDLLRMGYSCPIDVCPILIPFSDYDKTPSSKILHQYEQDGYTNILFVGRIAPNKCQEDVLSTFCCYQRCYNPRARLILAGSWGGMELYYQRLQAYAERLGIAQQVIFTGHIKFEEILAWYRLADAFLCMSEHEGFCVPLVEAMYFDVPIVAYRSSAIPDTLGGSGVLLDDKRPDKAANAIYEVIHHQNYRQKILNDQHRRLQDFHFELVHAHFKQLLIDFQERRKQPNPQIVQLSATISRGDAVSNDIIAFQNVFLEKGYPSKIYTEAQPTGKGWEEISSTNDLPQLTQRDIAVYHHATGTALAKEFAVLPCKKVMVYHNITPPSFFERYDKDAAQSCRSGLDNLLDMKGKIDYCIAVSEFNRQDLLKMGYTCPIYVCPILIPFKDYERTPDAEVTRHYQDGRTNIIFVGRVAPNKKFEDVIAAFDAYQKLDPTARLILVGSYDPNGKYFGFLKERIRELGVDHVEFTGHISFEKIIAYYQVADVFLCMSEHEGFCVPLVEAMYFDVPVVAYASTAIPETMGKAGILLDTKVPETAARAVYEVVNDAGKHTAVLKCQRERLKDFSHENVANTLNNVIFKIAGEE